MNTLKILKNDDLIATNSEHAFVGAIVYWRLSGNIRLDPFKAAWIKEGLEEKLLPKLPSVKVSLTRAVDDVATRGRLKTTVKDGGYALLDKTEKNGLTVNVNCRVTLDATENLIVQEQVPGKAPGTKTWAHLEKHPLLGQLTAAFESHKGSLESRDITCWLCKDVMDSLGATTLRESGGIYFVPRDKVERFNRMVQALKAVSDHKIYQVKAMTGDEAVEAVLDAIVAEAEAAAKAVEEDLAQGQGEKEGEDSETKPLGPRALSTRADRCREMVNKVRQYEELLGKMMPQITERLDDLKVAAMEASLAAKAE